eukprot:321105_1
MGGVTGSRPPPPSHLVAGQLQQQQPPPPGQAQGGDVRRDSSLGATSQSAPISPGGPGVALGASAAGSLSASHVSLDFERAETVASELAQQQQPPH